MSTLGCLAALALKSRSAPHKAEVEVELRSMTSKLMPSAAALLGIAFGVIGVIYVQFALYSFITDSGVF